MASSFGIRSDGQLSNRDPDIVSTSGKDGPIPTIANKNRNESHIHGTGNTIINSSTNNAFYRTDPKDSNNIQGKIAAALRPRHVPEATYDAQLIGGCMAGTRVQILTSADSWIKNPKAPKIFWLTGHAGSGKSAIGHTVCSRASDDPDVILGGSFFCSRSAGSIAQRDVRSIVPTLAQLMARQSPEFSIALAAELARDPDVLHKQISAQVETLLQKPLLSLKDSRSPILFVIDALDECGGQLTSNGTLDDPDSHRIVSAMLEALVAFSRSADKLPVKFLVTSRPETHIRNTPVSDAKFSKILQLHTVDKNQVTEDIRLYISTRLTSTSILRDWFTADHAEALARLCDGLFIVATTAIQYVFGDGADNAPLKFQDLLNATRDGLSTGAVAPLDRMYELILADATMGDKVDTQPLQAMLRVLASLLAARMTLSVSALADLLNFSKLHLKMCLSRLHAVVHVPENDNEPGLRTLHASFGDFLLQRADHRYRINPALGDAALSNGCLRVMSEQLHFNVSQSRSSYEGNQSKKPNSITLALEYACLHWIYHISRVPARVMSEGKSSSSFRQTISSLIPGAFSQNLVSKLTKMVDKIFRPRLLFWLEVMSVLRQVRRAAAMLVFAAGTVQSTDLSRFLRDANAFVASSQEAIERSAPHIYVSALPLAPKDSLVYREFAPLCLGLIHINVLGIDHHAGKLVMSLTGHTDAVNAIAYSLDGRFIGSGSTDGTVRIWDTRTGEEAMSPLRSDDGTVWSVAFASSGTKLSSGTEAGDVCLWSLVGGLVAPQRLTGHSGAILSVEFSSDESRLASGSRDHTVRMWNVQTGQNIAVLDFHTECVNMVAFSPGGKTLASGSDDKTIRLRRGTTDGTVRDSKSEYAAPISSICFAPDGTRIAAACEDDVILCKAKTGSEISILHSDSRSIESIHYSSDGRRLVLAAGESVHLLDLSWFGRKSSSISLNGHTGSINSVKFSPDGLYIASAGDDCTVRIWNAESGKSTVQTLTGHTGMVSWVTVTPDGSQIISSSQDCSIHVWDAQTGASRISPLHGHGDAVVCAIVSPNGRLIASASVNNTIRLWNMSTGNHVGKSMANDHQNWPHSLRMAFSPDSRWLATALKGNAACVWDVTTQLPSPMGTLSCNGHPSAFAFSPDGRLLAAGCYGGYMHLWWTGKSEPAREPLRANNSNVYSVIISPDGARIVSGGGDGAVRIWDIGTGTQTLVLNHTAPVWSVTYSNDGLLIASACRDHNVRLWNSETGALIATLNGHTDEVNSVAFTPNGRSIVSGADDCTIRVWDVGVACLNSSALGYDAVSTLGSASHIDGWLRGPSGELLLWVPAKYRKYVRISPCTLKIGPGKLGNVSIRVGDEGWHCGATWEACWRKNTPNPTYRTT